MITGKKNPEVKVVLDTNVYISAILFGRKPEEVRKLSQEGKIELLVSEAIIAEVAEILILIFYPNLLPLLFALLHKYIGILHRLGSILLLSLPHASPSLYRL